MFGDLLNFSRMADGIRALSRSQAMIEFTPEGLVLNANENFCKAMGYRLDEIIGQHHSMFCEPEVTQSPDYVKFWKDLTAGEFKSGQFRRRSKGDQDVWLEASYNPVFHGSKVVRILKIASDITVTKCASLPVRVRQARALQLSRKKFASWRSGLRRRRRRSPA